MAKFKVTPALIPPPIKITPAKYTLELTPEELSVIIILMRGVGGDPEGSIRKYVQSVLYNIDRTTILEFSPITSDRLFDYSVHGIHARDNSINDPVFVKIVSKLSKRAVA